MTSRPSKRPEPRFDWFIPIDGDGERIGTDRAEREPTFDGLQSALIDIGTRRLVRIQYTRAGAAGIERVRQYSVPLGRTMFRVHCVASLPDFVRHEAVFAHVAETITDRVP